MLVTNHNFGAAIYELSRADTLVVDLETTGLRPFHGDKIVGIAIMVPNGTPYYFPFGHAEGPNLSPAALQAIVGLLSNPAVLHVGHNYKFDIKFLTRIGMPIPYQIADTVVGATLLDENLESHSLKPLGDRWFGPDSSLPETELMDKLAALGHRGKSAKAFMWKLPSYDVAPYAEQDVVLTGKLFEKLVRDLSAWGLLNLWREYNDYLLALTRMEILGIAIDRERIHSRILEAERETNQLRQEIRDLTGVPDLNPNSPKQLVKVLGSDDTTKETLERLTQVPGPKHLQDLARLILKYRHYSKAESAFYRPYLEWQAPDGAIHPDFKLGGTVTGRLSCREPNLQQVPRDADTVKSAFVARPGYVFIEADYEQAELRLAAHLAGEQRMVEVFAAGRDPHQETADAMGVSRQTGKHMNFGVIYGIGVGGLMQRWNISSVKAHKLLEDFYKVYPAFKDAQRLAERQAKDYGYVKMWTGRLRRFPDSEKTYKAFNSLIQGGIAEIVRRAITRIDGDLPDVRLILQVHDSILAEVPEDRPAELAGKIQDAMLADNDRFIVPMAVEMKIGPSWGRMERIEA